MAEIYNGTSGDDAITNYSWNDIVSINAGAGDDSIVNSGSSVTIDGGAGHDSIYNSYWSSLTAIYGGAGNDTIENHGDSVLIDGGDGNDFIENQSRGANVTIDGGKGNDVISLICPGNLIRYAAGGGNDTIFGFNESDTLTITGSSYSTQTSGNDVIVTVGKGSILLKGAKGKSLNINQTNSANIITLTDDADQFYNYISNITISGGEGNDTLKNGDDTVRNTAANVSISGGAGNDYIENSSNSYVTLDGGEGNDSIRNIYTGNNVKIYGGTGDDSIHNGGASVTIDGGAGNDSISNYGSKVTITTGDGDDSVYNEGSKVLIGLNDYDKAGNKYIETYGDSVTAFGGSGNDEIYNGGRSVAIHGADGNDTIENGDFGNKVTISGNAGNDSILNNGDSVTIDGGGDNDTITNNGSTVTIEGGKGNDTISNKGDNVLFSYYSGDGNDLINGFNETSKLSISGSSYSTTKSGKNVIVTVANGKITLKGAATLSTLNILGTPSTGNGISISNSRENILINGTSGNDSVCDANYSGGTAYNVTINTGAGDDLISLLSTGHVVKYKIGDGNDTIFGFNESDMLTITGGKYSTRTSGDDVIVNAGNGSILLKGAKDKSLNINKKSTTNIITLTDNADILHNYLNNITIQAFAGNDIVYNKSDSVTVDAGDGNDYIDNGYLRDANNVSISGGAGNDYIQNRFTNSYVTLDGGAGKDSIDNYGDDVTINAGTGNDYIENRGSNVSISGGKGNDIITLVSSYSWSKNSFIQYSSGDGNDKIYGFHETSTLSISGGSYSTAKSGDDVIVTVGDGKISLIGAASLSAVNIVDEKTPIDKNSWKLSGTTVTYGMSDKTLLTVNGVKSLGGISLSNKVVTIAKTSLGTSKVTISGDGYKLALADDVAKSSTTKKSWSLSNTTATYNQTKSAYYTLASNSKSISCTKSTSKTLTTVKGVKSTDGLSVSGKVVTVSDASLNQSAVTISNGYKLALADDVAKSSTTKKSWSLSNTTASYKQTKIAYYTLASNSKSITYKKSTSKTLTTVSGVKSTDGLSVSGKVVTVGDASLNKKAVTISNGYTLKLGSDVIKSTSTAAKWTLSNSTATYKSAKKTTGYKLASNKISYVTAGGGKVLAKISGVKSKPTLSGKVVTLKTSNIGAAKKVSVSGNYTFNFSAGDYKNASVIGTANADTIVGNGTNLFISGGKGNDSLISNSSGGNVFVYNDGDGNDVITNFAATDKLSIKSAATYSVSGSDVVFSVGTGSITLKDAKDKTFTYYVDGTEKTYSTVTVKPYTISGKGVSLTSAYVDDEFDVSTVKSGSSIVTINGSKVSHALKINGNAKANKIIGTGNDDKIYGGNGKDSINGGSGNDTLRGDSGNDTLTGGKGSDVFIYYEGNGNDVISDYAAEDTIIIDSDSAITAAKKYSDVVLKVGNGSITLRDAHQDKIGVTYFENGVEHDFINGKQAVTFDGTEQVRIAARYWKDSFDVTNFDNRRNIDGSAVTHDLSISGNKLANKIIGGSGKNTLIGGAGDDTLQGGDKADVFVYGKGDGRDIIYGYGEGDIISIKSGAATASVKGDTVILTVGNGKISIDGAAGKTVTYYDDNGRTSKIFSANSNDDIWFMDDENYIGADNQLSSIVQTHGAAFATNLVPSLSSLVPTNDSLPALTYSAKK